MRSLLFSYPEQALQAQFLCQSNLSSTHRGFPSLQIQWFHGKCNQRCNKYFGWFQQIIALVCFFYIYICKTIIQRKFKLLLVQYDQHQRFDNTRLLVHKEGVIFFKIELRKTLYYNDSLSVMKNELQVPSLNLVEL